MKNIIGKQILDFQYIGKAKGLVLQNEVSNWCNDILIPEMEKMFDTFSNDDIYLSIDKLELNAVVDESDWQEKLKNELLINLKEKLNKHKTSLHGTNDQNQTSHDGFLSQTTNASDETNDQNEPTHNDFLSQTNNAINETNAQNEILSKKRDELVFFYFEKGFLPWWGKTLIENDFETLLVKWLDNLANIDNTRVKIFKKQLKELIVPEVIERIVNIVPRRYFFQFIRVLYKKENALISILENLFKGSVENKLPLEKQKDILQSAFKWLAVSDSNESLNKEKVQHFLFKEIYEQTGLLPQDEKASDFKIELPLKDEKQRKEILSNIKIKKRLPLREIEEEDFYIENAGAILMAPFLPALFDRLKLANKTKLLNPALATLIVQYAVTGKSKMEEYELVLPKILCGLDIESVVDAAFKILPKQKHEVSEMLSSIIEYWTVLKNTSLAGLQESFLKRAGKLTFKENNCLLQIEQKSYDMLLNNLPWNISMIKLPWMKGIIRTEWV